MQRHTFSLLGFFGALALSYAGTASAQQAEPWRQWQTDWNAEAILVAAPGRSDGPLQASEDFLYAVDISASAETILQNGLEIGARGSLGIQRDHPRRSGGSGAVFSSLAADGADTGAFSGLASRGLAEDRGPRAQVEAAYVYVKGGYGEARMGRDRGVAARFHEGAPSIFSHARTDSARLDPSGLALVRTRHDLTGPAAKVTATSPRIVGVRAGASFTPRADTSGLDRDPRRAVSGQQPLDIRNAVEVAANFNRRLRTSGVRVQASAAWSRADVERPARAQTTVETVSFGGSAEWGESTLGVSWLDSNNGTLGQNGDFSSWNVGYTREFGVWEAGIDYGEAKDRLSNLESESWSVGLSRSFGDTLAASFGYRATKTGQLTQFRASDRGIVIEITRSK